MQNNKSIDIGHYHLTRKNTKMLNKLETDKQIQTTWILNRDLSENELGKFILEINEFCEKLLDIRCRTISLATGWRSIPYNIAFSSSAAQYDAVLYDMMQFLSIKSYYYDEVLFSPV